MQRSVRLALLLALSLPAFLAAAAPNPVAEGTQGVAWQAQERFMFSHHEPVGLNTEAQAAVLSGTAQGRWVVEVRIPLAGFHSIPAKRDKVVFKMLGGDAQPELLFRSAELDAKALLQLRDHGGSLDGTLKIAGQEHPIQFTVQGDGQEISGTAEIPFKAVGLKAPRAMLGMILSVKDALVLGFRYKVAAVAGADKVK